jgi:hypothetical protein
MTQNQKDQAEIQSVLHRNDVYDSSREWLEGCQLWLTNNPQRFLSPCYRDRLRNIVHACTTRDEHGNERGLTEAEFKAFRTRPNPRKAWPDWLKGGKTELPPRPPQRVPV